MEQEARHLAHTPQLVAEVRVLFSVERSACVSLCLMREVLAVDGGVARCSLNAILLRDLSPSYCEECVPC